MAGKMTNPYQLCQISQVGIWIKDGKCLILQFNQPDAKWGLPGGRIDEGMLQAGKTCESEFRREIREELGITNLRVIDVVHYDFTGVISRSTNSPVIGIASLMASDEEAISLSEEHTAYRWITPDELGSIIFKWQCAKQMILKGFEYINES